jgi:hypothetical protein
MWNARTSLIYQLSPYLGKLDTPSSSKKIIKKKDCSNISSFLNMKHRGTGFRASESHEWQLSISFFRWSYYRGLSHWGSHSDGKIYGAFVSRKKNYMQEVKVIMIRVLVIIHRRHTNVLFADYTFSILTGDLKIQNRKTTKVLKNQL